MVPVFSADNAKAIISSLQKFGITNPFMQAALLAIAWKESAIKPGRENMKYTTPERIMFVWPKKFPTRESALPYVNNPEGLANLMYGGKYGNAPDQGFFYRGGGYNGITFKSNYDNVAKLSGHPINKNPDLLKDYKIAADAFAAYYADQFDKYIEKYMGVESANDIDSVNDSVRAAMKATAGWASPENGNIFKEGQAKALDVYPTLYNFVRNENPGSDNGGGGGGGVPVRSNIILRAWKNKRNRPFIVVGSLAVIGGLAYGVTRLNTSA